MERLCTRRFDQGKLMNDFEKKYEALKKADSELSKKTRKVAENFTEEQIDKLDKELEKIDKKIEKKANFHNKLKDSPLIVIVVIILFILFAYFYTS